MTGLVTWGELAEELASTLRDDGDVHGVDRAGIDARRIVEAASGAEGSAYHDVLGRPATRRGVAAVDRMAARRQAGEPLQYVVGRWGFRTLDLFVDDRVLIPRPETEVVAGFALDEIDRSGHRTIVDLGTGSGAIALAIAVERPATTVWATDRSADALDVARANLAGTGRSAARVQLAEGTWYDALPADLEGVIDLVVSNPPYVAEGDELPSVVADWEPTSALVAGPDGTEEVIAVIEGAVRWLRPGGALVVELAPPQAAPMAALAAARGFADVDVGRDLSGRDRAVIARMDR